MLSLPLVAMENIMFFFKKLSLIFVLLSMSSVSYANIAVSAVVEQAKEAADDLIAHAFDRLDFTLLQTAVDTRATINEASYNLKDVMGYSIDRLDGQQRRLISDLEQFKKSVSKDAKATLDELREEKNQAVSDLRLLISNYPGAIRIISGHALEGTRYVDFKVYGSALSKVKISNSRLNNRPVIFSIPRQSDTSMIIRVPVSSAISQESLAQSRGKPGEIKMEFEFVEDSWIFFTKKRKFSDIGYIIPKQIGTATAVYSGEIEKKDYQNWPDLKCSIKPVESSVGVTGRKRGKITGKCINEPPSSWRFDTRSANFKLTKNGECSNGKSNASWASKNELKLQVDYHIVSHKGVRSGTCRSSLVLKSRIWKLKRYPKNVNTPIQKIYANSDNKFNLRPDILRELKGIRLSHIEVRSPFFEQGVKYLRLGDSNGGLSTSYDRAGHISYLRFTKMQ